MAFYLKRPELMSRIRSTGNKRTELVLASALRQAHVSGWRRHFRISLPPNAKEARSSSVRPDFVFRSARVALFIDGCFWHVCPRHGHYPKGNKAFWRKKLIANITRDKFVTHMLRRAGWRVLRIWEHDLAKNPERCLKRIKHALS